MRTLLAFLTILIGICVSAQEVETPLSFDPIKALDSQERTKESEGSSIQQRIAVDLPFRDDFSQDHFPGNPAANVVLWEDLNVKLSSGFAVDPPSIGVLVFDGLNKDGYPYDNGSPTNEGYADTLTSVEVNLAGASDLVLSFFYQPQGRGEAPDPADILHLEFYNALDEEWSLVWTVNGSILQPFQQILLEIESQYVQDGFRFRFYNYGNLTGALDQWSLDWVYLDQNRSVNDSVLVDVGFAYQEHSLLNRKHTSMPWEHFRTSPEERMLPAKDIRLLNNRTQAAFIDGSGYEVSYDGTVQESFTDSEVPSAQPNEILAISQEVNSAPNFYVYPTNVNDTCADFTVSFSFNTSPDLNEENNHMQFTQRFHNFYSYDDGEAEQGYGVENANGAKIAFKHEIFQEDTLLAVQMYFLPLSLDVDDELLAITVWADDNGAPGEELYQDDISRTVEYTQDGSFHQYDLQDTLVLSPGEYFIGWVQAGDERLNIGNDKSLSNNLGRLYFNTGSNWTPTTVDGTLMIRPVFPSLRPDPITGLEDSALESISVHYLQESGQIQISGVDRHNLSAQIFDIQGRLVSQYTLAFGDNLIPIPVVNRGLYIVRLHSQSGAQRTERIVIQR